jgi:hypothetical protein
LDKHWILVGSVLANDGKSDYPVIQSLSPNQLSATLELLSQKQILIVVSLFTIILKDQQQETNTPIEKLYFTEKQHGIAKTLAIDIFCYNPKQKGT